MEQLERPQSYEGEYLSADDLTALVQYVRHVQARHGLGAHVWGIGAGLDVIERPIPSGDVELVITPGVAWDGYARPLVALAPQHVGLELFADFQDDTAPSGVPIEIWLNYRELAARPPGVGFSCPDDDLHGRIVETFRLEVRRSPITDYHAVTLAGRQVEARKAASTFDPSKAPLYDESVAAQTFPDTDRQRWPLFVGMARWRKDPGQPGRLIARIDDDRNRARRMRRYLGVVAETVLAADGVLRLRDRSRDPLDPTVNFRSPIVAAPAGTTPVNDLVWCEGHLRVAGDTRIQGGALDYLEQGGADDGIPMRLRRVKSAVPTLKVTLDAFVGQPPAAPPNAQTRFAVSTGDPAAPTERLTVITDGRVGISAPDPTNTLHVNGPSGIRHGHGYVTGDQSAAFTALAFNAFKPGSAPWKTPDPTHSPAAIVLDDQGGVPSLTFQTSTGCRPAGVDGARRREGRHRSRWYRYGGADGTSARRAERAPQCRVRPDRSVGASHRRRRERGIRDSGSRTPTSSSSPRSRMCSVPTARSATNTSASAPTETRASGHPCRERASRWRARPTSGAPPPSRARRRARTSRTFTGRAPATGTSARPTLPET